MATKSSVGWLILAFALAVPGVLFYQWYTHLDLEKKKALSMKVRLSETGLFQNSPKKDKLVNPIAAVSVAASTASAEASTAPAAGFPEPIAAAAPAPLLSESPAAAVEPAGSPEVAYSTGSQVNAFLAWRDPTLSPYDQVRMEQIELEKQIRLQELQEAAEQKGKPVRKAVVQIEKFIDLQGIVSAGGVNKAIVNNEVVGEGDLVKTSAGPVRIVRITIQSVGFAFKDKRFSKSVSR